MNTQEIFNDLEHNPKTVEYQGEEVKIYLLSLDESHHENTKPLAKQLENLPELDKKARYYLAKSLDKDGDFLAQLSSSVMEEGDTEAVENMTSQAFAESLKLTDIYVYVDEPENEIYAFEKGGILNYFIEPTTTDESIHIAMQYLPKDENISFGEWELLVMFNLAGECVQSYFNKQY